MRPRLAGIRNHQAGAPDRARRGRHSRLGGDSSQRATLAVSQGKGVDDDARSRLGDDGGDRGRHRRAARSAASDLVAARDGGLRTPHGAADRTAARRRVAAGADEPIDWIEGFDLIDDAPVWVPLDAVQARRGGGSGALLAIDRRSRLGQRALGSGVSRLVRARRARRADAVVAARRRRSRANAAAIRAISTILSSPRLRPRSKRPDFACACSTFRPTSRSPSASPRSRRRRTPTRRAGAISTCRAAAAAIPIRRAPPFAP